MSAREQTGESAPGPLIVDPPGPYTGRGYVAALKSSLDQANALSTFVVTYNGFTPQAQAAFQAAVDVWASQIQSPVPIRVTANWTDLGPQALGSAGPVTIHRNFAGAKLTDTWYAAPLANKMFGSDLDATNDDIIANFNSTVNWYYGTDGNAGVNFDLMTVVLHELAHGLGFFGSMTVSSGIGTWGFSGSPVSYDRFAVNGSSQRLLNTTLFPNDSAALAAQLTGNSVYFDGANAMAANGGLPARLYAPATWVSGSSYSHLSESTFPPGNANSLMTPSLGSGEAIHDPGSIVRGAFYDMGYDPPVTQTRRDDYNGDHLADVLWRHSSGAVALWLMSGFQTIGGGNYSVDGAWQIAGSGDFNADGRADILWRHSSGVVVLWLMNGTTILGSGNVATVDPSWHVAGTGDANGDGRADILWRHTSGAVAIWLMNGAATIGGGTIGTVDVAWNVLGSGDYNGDGKADLLWRHTSGAISMWLMNGSAITSGIGMGSIDPAWQIAGSGDFNADGKSDFVWRNTTSGEVAVWLMNGGTILGGGAGGSAPTAWQIVGTGDYNGDGRSDLIWRHTSGTTVVWFMNGTSAFGGGTVGNVDPAWQTFTTR